MTPKPPHPLDVSRSAVRRRRMAALADHLRRHHSAVGYQELLAIGFSSSGVDRLVEDGLLVSTARGSFRSGLAAPTQSTWLRGMLLSAGPGAFLTRVSASHHQGNLDHPPREPQIAVPRRISKTRRDGFWIYPATNARPHEVRLVDGLRCSTPDRTIVDLAVSTRTSGDFKMLRRTVRQATQKDRQLPARLERDVNARRPFRGRRVLLRVLEGHLPATLVQRSDLEADFLALLRRHGLPIPETNVMVEGFELDVLFREQRVFVELDTFGTHGTADSFERDRERDAVILVAGYRGIRVTDKRLRREPMAIIRQLRKLLGLG